MSIGDKIDRIWGIREEIRELESKIKDLAKAKELIEEELLKQMDAEGITKSTGHRASVSISENIKPQVEDWDAFYAYIHKYGYFHLLERRPSVTGCRELFETKGMIPGVVPWTKRTVNLRTID